MRPLPGKTKQGQSLSSVVLRWECACSKVQFHPRHTASFAVGGRADVGVRRRGKPFTSSLCHGATRLSGIAFSRMASQNNGERLDIRPNRMRLERSQSRWGTSSASGCAKRSATHSVRPACRCSRDETCRAEEWVASQRESRTSPKRSTDIALLGADHRAPE